MKKIISFISLCFVVISLFALEVPPLTKAVNDNADILNSEQKAELEKYLKDVDKTSHLQVALLTVSSLEGEALESYSMRVAEKWKLGDATRNSGALLLISKEDRKIRIEVGYGLEKDLTDAISSQIIRDVITPHFKQNDYYNGIKKGLQAIVAYALKDETLIKDVNKDNKNMKEKGKSDRLYWYIAIALILLFSIFGRRFGNKKHSGWNVLWLLSSLLDIFTDNSRHGNKRSTHYDGNSFSSDDDNSSDSFSGKGGSFGGGGASGGW